MCTLTRTSILFLFAHLIFLFHLPTSFFYHLIIFCPPHFCFYLPTYFFLFHLPTSFFYHLIIFCPPHFCFYLPTSFYFICPPHFSYFSGYPDTWLLVIPLKRIGKSNLLGYFAKLVNSLYIRGNTLSSLLRRIYSNFKNSRWTMLTTLSPLFWFCSRFDFWQIVSSVPPLGELAPINMRRKKAV